MLEEEKRTIAYLCPSCRNAVIAEKTVFALAAAPSAIPCPCGKSELKIELVGDRARLSVPCLFCKTDHTVECATHALLHQKALAFACAASGLDCCYVGQEGPVFAAMKRLEAAADKLEAAAGEAGSFLDPVVMEEVLAELKEIAGRDGISCACGSHKWKMQLNYSAVDLFCDNCGGVLRLPAATEDDLTDLCCKHTLLLSRGGVEHDVF